MMTINCGCEKCCSRTEWGGIAPHRIKITKRGGTFIARGHAIDDYEVIEGAKNLRDIVAMYDSETWQLRHRTAFRKSKKGGKPCPKE